jgi:hypothetical protein
MFEDLKERAKWAKEHATVQDYLKETRDHINDAAYFGLVGTLGVVGGGIDNGAGGIWAICYFIASLSSLGAIRSYADYGEKLYAPCFDGIAKDMWKSA